MATIYLAFNCFISCVSVESLKFCILLIGGLFIFYGESVQHISDPFLLSLANSDDCGFPVCSAARISVHVVIFLFL